MTQGVLLTDKTGQARFFHLTPAEYAAYEQHRSVPLLPAHILAQLPKQ